LLVLTDAKKPALWSNVPTGMALGIKTCGQSCVEELGEVVWRAEEGDATAHGSSLP
jgi:hypothetical protein